MKCGNCGLEMSKAINVRYLQNTDMPCYADCGTLIATQREEYIKRIVGGVGIKETQYGINPQIYVCKNCGLIQRFLSKDDLDKIEFA
jgi:hypothetical protein